MWLGFLTYRGEIREKDNMGKDCVLYLALCIVSFVCLWFSSFIVILNYGVQGFRKHMPFNFIIFGRRQLTCVFAHLTNGFQESFSVGPAKEVPVEFNILSRRAGNKT